MSSPWPPPAGLSTPFVPAAATSLSVSAACAINAPAALVFAVVRNTADYPLWNEFVPRVKVTSQPAGVADPRSTELVNGTEFLFYPLMNLARPGSPQETALVVSHLSTPEKPDSAYLAALAEDASFWPEKDKVYRIAWKGIGSVMTNFLKNERFHEVIPGAREDETLVRTWENMGGALASTVKLIYGDNLKGKFELWCKNLKDRSERLYKPTTPP